MARVEEVVDRIHRICTSVQLPDTEVLDPGELGYVILLHFEADENGGMDRFLEGAPNSTLACLSAVLNLSGWNDAQGERFLGSPTVRINGRDIEPGGERRTDYGLKCRLYRAPTGLSAQPPEQLLRSALRSAAGAIA